jgi:AraC-like DNA-binding protein
MSRRRIFMSDRLALAVKVFPRAIVQGMDVIADVLSVAGVRGTVAGTAEAGREWGFAFEATNAACFHAIGAGTAWLRVPDVEPLQLMPGDIVLVPRGGEHGLAGAVDTPLVPFSSIAISDEKVFSVGEPPAQTRIHCGHYQHEASYATPLFELLPDLLHIPATPGSAPGLEATLGLLALELSEPRLGRPTVLDRLIDIILVQILRVWVDLHPQSISTSWLRALADPPVAAALAAIHAEPARSWTIASLAESASVSRATLARRFTALVGQPPNRYLASWRMDLAARELLDTDRSIESIAKEVGYNSEFAFSKAFTRLRGTPPGRYRRRQ